jgi:hypothetical protein
LYGKEEAKDNRHKSSLGNDVDKLIRSMRYGQTNGIPQGSVLMDFIAEMVLGYADTLIIEKLKEIERNKDYEILHKDYEILRYRDDLTKLLQGSQY